MRREKSQIVLVTPFWVIKIWFPSVMEMAIEKPFLIQYTVGMLIEIEGEEHTFGVDF